MIHLAELIKDEMRERNWTLDNLVMNMGPHFTKEEWGVCHLSWEMFMTLRDRTDVLLGDVMAGQLEDAFDVPASFFLDFHNNWRDAQPRASKGESHD